MITQLQIWAVNLMAIMGFAMSVLFAVEVFMRTAMMTWKVVRDLWRER